MPAGLQYSETAITDLISAPRFSAYVEAAHGSTSALNLYEWNASMASALFELVGHVEVILRNAIDAALRVSLNEAERRIPWFMLNLPKVEARIESLEYSNLELDRDRALSSLTMGFWAKLVGTESLWNDMVDAFVSGCDRDMVVRRVKRAHLLRNRLAHHASMLDVDVRAEVENLVDLAALVSSDARNWLSQIERASEVVARRPVTVPDTVLIPATAAWPTYLKVAAYVCQAGRSFRDVKRLAFYSSGAIQREVPRILDQRDGVEWSSAEAQRLGASSDPLDRQLANTIKYTKVNGWDADFYQVFLLTREGAASGDHRILPKPIRHVRTGRGSAFVRKQRYFHYEALASATTTDDLPRSYFFADPLPTTSDDAASPDEPGQVSGRDMA